MLFEFCKPFPERFVLLITKLQAYSINSSPQGEGTESICLFSMASCVQFKMSSHAELTAKDSLGF